MNRISLDFFTFVYPVILNLWGEKMLTISNVCKIQHQREDSLPRKKKNEFKDLRKEFKYHE